MTYQAPPAPSEVVAPVVFLRMHQAKRPQNETTSHKLKAFDLTHCNKQQICRLAGRTQGTQTHTNASLGLPTHSAVLRTISTHHTHVGPGTCWNTSFVFSSFHFHVCWRDVEGWVWTYGISSRGRKFQKKKELYSKERICL